MVKTASKSKPLKATRPIRSPQTSRKPVNVYIQEIKSIERRIPLRAKSFEETETSPSKSKRSAVVRSGSMDEPRPNIKSKKISNDQELIQSDPISCPQNQKGNN